MDQKHAIAALAALAQETRLELFRLLVTCGPEGLPAGVIAERLGVQPSSLSFHLAGVRQRVLGGNEGVATRIKIGDGSIGYVEYGFANASGCRWLYCRTRRATLSSRASRPASCPRRAEHHQKRRRI